MELTSMFLNQLTNKTTNNMISTNKTSSDFNEVLEKVENKTSNVKKDKVKADKSYSKYNDKYKPLDRPKDKQSVVKDDVKVDKKEPLEDKEKVIVIDKDSLDKLSDTLGISSDKIMDILSSLSLSISMLQDSENLINFLQNVFNTESPVELLSMDNIKDIMKNITDIAKNIDYTDIMAIDESIKDKINDIIQGNNLKDITLLSSKDSDIQQKISELLEELNGSIEKNIENKNMLNNGLQTKVELGIDGDKSLEDLGQLDTNGKAEEIKTNNERAGYYQENSKNNNQSSLFEEKIVEKVAEQNNKQGVFSISEVSNSTRTLNLSLPKTQVLKNINTSDVVAQIMEKIKFSIKPDISEVKMLLKPEQLGEVSLKIATQNGIVTAQFIAENQKVKEIIESNFNQLRDMLSEQGVDVGALEVNVSNNEEETTYNMFEQNSEKSEKRVNNLIESILNKEELNQQNQIKEEHIMDSQVNYSI
ncbi:flagellar hook-length control protein FliK [uncultured Tyzzerella sp.]|uniref:flagellar hook-length control protein FliK n=1 Tax=uncultured Tyzzerella sp. TaxID=2321398 RepID=UPI0029428E27|nr:flagellar hook-length control protein FliK [uncultured Tyzzerella sp.]